MDTKQLSICIIGAGMGGLTCALELARAGFQNVSIYEYASNLGFVGAGIQLAPNMQRILDRLGVWKEIDKEAVVLNETSIRREFMIYPFGKCYESNILDQRAILMQNWAMWTSSIS